MVGETPEDNSDADKKDLDELAEKIFNLKFNIREEATKFKYGSKSKENLINALMGMPALLEQLVKVGKEDKQRLLSALEVKDSKGKEENKDFLVKFKTKHLESEVDFKDFLKDEIIDAQIKDGSQTGAIWKEFEKRLANNNANEEAARKAKEEAERKAKEEADAKAKEEAERKAQEESTFKDKLSNLKSFDTAIADTDVAKTFTLSAQAGQNSLSSLQDEINSLSIKTDSQPAPSLTIGAIQNHLEIQKELYQTIFDDQGNPKIEPKQENAEDGEEYFTLEAVEAFRAQYEEKYGNELDAEKLYSKMKEATFFRDVKLDSADPNNILLTKGEPGDENRVEIAISKPRTEDAGFSMQVRTVNNQSIMLALDAAWLNAKAQGIENPSIEFEHADPAVALKAFEQARMMGFEASLGEKTKQALEQDENKELKGHYDSIAPPKSQADVIENYRDRQENLGPKQKFRS